MKESLTVFKAGPKPEQARFRAGTRATNLALAQTREAVQKIGAFLPAVRFEIVHFSSPGDRDRIKDLRESKPDFFTRDLDQAVLSGEIDCAIHSAKDISDPITEGLDWFWLPWHADPRDVLVTRTDRKVQDLSSDAVIGVSSDRREAYCRKRFPDARIAPVRGNVEERVAKLDAGEYDLLIIAAAGLERLGLAHRISEWIPLEDLTPPDGQGYLAITFRAGDQRFLKLRRLFIKSVDFVGAGPGDTGLCTVAGRDAIKHCDVCLYDALVLPELLDSLPAGARAISVGRRSGRHKCTQNEISRLLRVYARRGKKVVRVKGGDPGIFGRLAEEIAVLDELQLPYRVIPGVSSLNAATAGTGLTLTRREISQGFVAMTPVGASGEEIPVGVEQRLKLPLAFFMGIERAGRILAELRVEGLPASMPCALILDSGRETEEVICGTIGDMPTRLEDLKHEKAGILLVGEIAASRFLYGRWGALEGKKVLLTCSEALMNRAGRLVTDYGGRPVRRPMIRLLPEPNAATLIEQIQSHDWIVLTSPSAADCLVSVLQRENKDIRCLPRILVTGAGTAARLRGYNLLADAVPESGFGGENVVETAGKHIEPDARVLRLRSDAAGDSLAKELEDRGYSVTDSILYRNEPIRYDAQPDFDAVFFASGSAVRAFAGNWDISSLQGKESVVMGNSAANALQSVVVEPTVTAFNPTIESAITALAAWYVDQRLMT